MIPIAYNIRSLRVRRATTAASALGLSLVIFVFATVQMLSNGISKSVHQAADPRVAILLRKAASSELESVIEREKIPLVASTPGVAPYADSSQPQVVGELTAVILLKKIGTEGGLANVLVRGVPDDAFAFRPNVTIASGRRAAPGTDEVIVGAAIAGRFEGLSIGQTFETRRNRPMTVVGIFQDGGSAYESEVWGDSDRVAESFGRGPVVSSIRVRLKSPDDFDAFSEAVDRNPELGLAASRDAKFYETTSGGTAKLVTAMGSVIAILLSFGAIIGAMITMHAAIANRQREIGTLRALGFTRTQILLSFLVESVVLSLIGGALGAAASLLMSLNHFSTINLATFAEVVFRFEPSVQIMVSAAAVATLMGIMGGFWPALRAARMDPIRAMRGA